jgi:hypothetical protein
VRILLAILLAFACQRAFAQQIATNDAAIRFRTVDIFMNSKDKPLAAYQIEFTATAGDVKIVGIEGGQHPAFSGPPFYDPKAMQHDRVIIAAFSTETAEELPKGKTRVATIHLQTKGAVEPKFELKVDTAADAGGNRITAEGSFVERKTK